MAKPAKAPSQNVIPKRIRVPKGTLFTEYPLRIQAVVTTSTDKKTGEWYVQAAYVEVLEEVTFRGDFGAGPEVFTIPKYGKRLVESPRLPQSSWPPRSSAKAFTKKLLGAPPALPPAICGAKTNIATTYDKHDRHHKKSGKWVCGKILGHDEKHMDGPATW